MRFRSSASALTLLAVVTFCGLATPAGSSAPSSSNRSQSGVASPRDSTTGTITGVVLNGNTPVAGVCVSAVPFITADPTATTVTASDGSYTLNNLSPSEYFLDFDPTCGGTIRSLLGSNTSQVADIAAGSTVVITVALPPAQGSISGVVTDTGGSPIAGVCVTWILGGDSGIGVTASNGSYSFGLAPSTYSLEFDPTCNRVKTSPFTGTTDYSVVVSPAATTTVNEALSSNTTTTTEPQGSTTTTSVPPDSGSSPTVAPPPTGVGIGVLATPLASEEAGGTSTSTFSVTLSGPVQVSVLVPSGALPKSEMMSFYPVADANDLTSLLPFRQWGQNYVTGVALSWIGSDGSISMAGSPISVTLRNADIKVGDPVYFMSNSGQLYDAGNASMQGVISVSLSAATLIVVATKPSSQGIVPSSPQPRAVHATFGSTSSNLSSATKSALLKMVKQLRPGAAVVVTGFALGSVPIAQARAEVVKRFLLAHRKLRVTIKIVTNRAASLVTVALLRQ